MYVGFIIPSQGRLSVNPDHRAVFPSGAAVTHRSPPLPIFKHYRITITHICAYVQQIQPVYKTSCQSDNAVKKRAPLYFHQSCGMYSTHTFNTQKRDGWVIRRQQIRRTQCGASSEYWCPFPLQLPSPLLCCGAFTGL